MAVNNLHLFASIVVCVVLSTFRIKYGDAAEITIPDYWKNSICEFDAEIISFKGFQLPNITCKGNSLRSIGSRASKLHVMCVQATAYFDVRRMEENVGCVPVILAPRKLNKIELF